VDLCCNVVAVEVEAVDGDDLQVVAAGREPDRRLPKAVSSAGRSETCCLPRSPRGGADVALYLLALCPALPCGISPC
jgi:hypothetical protein